MVTTTSTKPKIDRIAADLSDRYGERVAIGRRLSGYVTFGIGGEADLFVEVLTTQELSDVVKLANEHGVPFFMLGGGSNLLVSEKGYRGLIIRNLIRQLQIERTGISCGAGEDLQTLVDFAAENSLTGLEFAAGIYGTVGGAIYGNAGAYGSETGKVLESGELVDRKGNIRIESADYFEFGYRRSILKQTGEFVARAKFALKMGNKNACRRKIDEILSLRAQRLPANARTAGCFFKNVPNPNEPYGKLSAGKLLDEIGAKQMRCGGARVYEKHANILLNDGNASSGDVRKLAEQLKQKVKEKFGIELEEEITYIGDF